MTRRAPENNDNADWGRTAETAACDRWSLERISGDPDEPWWFDARVCDIVDPGDGFDTIEPGAEDDEWSSGGAPIEDVLDIAEILGFERLKAEHEIEKLRRQGEVYEPQTDHLRVT